MFSLRSSKSFKPSMLFRGFSFNFRVVGFLCKSSDVSMMCQNSEKWGDSVYRIKQTGTFVQ